MDCPRHEADQYDAPAAKSCLHPYSLCAKSQGMKQLMAGGGVALIGLLLVPQLTGLFG